LFVLYIAFDFKNYLEETYDIYLNEYCEETKEKKENELNNAAIESKPNQTSQGKSKDILVKETDIKRKEIEAKKDENIKEFYPDYNMNHFSSSNLPSNPPKKKKQETEESPEENKCYKSTQNFSNSQRNFHKTEAETPSPLNAEKMAKTFYKSSNVKSENSKNISEFKNSHPNEIPVESEIKKYKIEIPTEKKIEEVFGNIPEIKNNDKEIGSPRLITVEDIQVGNTAFDLVKELNKKSNEDKEVKEFKISEESNQIQLTYKLKTPKLYTSHFNTTHEDKNNKIRSKLFYNDEEEMPECNYNKPNEIVRKIYAEDIMEQKGEDCLEVKQETNLNGEESSESEDYDEMEYDEALLKDKRSLLKMYCDFLKINQTFIAAFTVEKLQPRKIKIFILTFILSGFFIFNAILFTEDYISERFTSESTGLKYLLKEELAKSIYASLIINVLIFIQGYIFSHYQIVKAMEENKEKDKGEAFQEIKKAVKKNQIKTIVIMSLMILLFLFFWFYISCFCGVFQGTQKGWIVASIISIIFFMIFSLVIILIATVIKKASYLLESFLLFKLASIVAELG
ncbi:MAG: hypothetical protein MJ252_27255, partial [archaeon]|nr:hypothetical protein [archaeon]